MTSLQPQASEDHQQRRPDTARWPLVAALVLTVAWLIAPAAVPIYDGIGNPDEPYRWVNPPAGAKHTPPPTIAHATLRAQNGRNLDAGYANSAETGPQISLYIPLLALATPPTATSVQVTATPQAPTPPAPSDGNVVSNVYRITATTSAGPAALPGSLGRDQPTLQMRAPTAQQPGPVFEHRNGNRWTRVGTTRVGNDVYQATLTGLGDWALVQIRQRFAAGGTRGINTPVLIAGVALLAAAIAVVVVRIARNRASAGN